MLYYVVLKTWFVVLVWMAPRQETNDDNISKQRVKQVACYCDSFLLIFFCLLIPLRGPPKIFNLSADNEARSVSAEAWPLTVLP